MALYPRPVQPLGGLPDKTTTSIGMFTVLDDRADLQRNGSGVLPHPCAASRRSFYRHRDPEGGAPARRTTGVIRSDFSRRLRRVIRRNAFHRRGPERASANMQDTRARLLQLAAAPRPHLHTASFTQFLAVDGGLRVLSGTTPRRP